MQSFLKYILVFLIASSSEALSTQNTFQPLVSEDREEKTGVSYSGYINNERIENIRVESHISLGGKYAQRIRETIEKADQFIVCFMYRF
jgi:hypothetical protein